MKIIIFRNFIPVEWKKRTILSRTYFWKRDFFGFTRGNGGHLQIKRKLSAQNRTLCWFTIKGKDFRFKSGFLNVHYTRKQGTINSFRWLKSLCKLGLISNLVHSNIECTKTCKCDFNFLMCRTTEQKISAEPALNDILCKSCKNTYFKRCGF